MHLVEALVPDLIDMTRFVPTIAHAVGRAIEEEQARHPLRGSHPKNLHHIGADVVTDETAAIDVHGVQQSDDILGQTGGIDGVGRLRVRVLALSESSKVRRYQPVAVSEPCEDRLPRRPEFGPAVQQHQRRANACLRDVMTNPTRSHEAALLSTMLMLQTPGPGCSSMKIAAARAQPALTRI